MHTQDVSFLLKRITTIKSIFFDKINQLLQFTIAVTKCHKNDILLCITEKSLLTKFYILA